MADMNPAMYSLLLQLKVLGPHIIVSGDEGPRNIGHCAYCAGPCEGSTTGCEVRVYFDRFRKA